MAIRDEFGSMRTRSILSRLCATCFRGATKWSAFVKRRLTTGEQLDKLPHHEGIASEDGWQVS
jgi:hypothetical protein